MQAAIFGNEYYVYQIVNDTNILVYGYRDKTIELLTTFTMGKSVRFRKMTISGRTMMVVGRLGNVRDYGMEFFLDGSNLVLHQILKDVRYVLDTDVLEDMTLTASGQSISLNGAGQYLLEKMDRLYYSSSQYIMDASILAIERTRFDLLIEIYLVVDGGIEILDFEVKPIVFHCTKEVATAQSVTLHVRSTCSENNLSAFMSRNTTTDCGSTKILNIRANYGI
jgi:hypothetical protein